jgi:uncharacterized membrane protein YbhN (UPF0104 family)
MKKQSVSVLRLLLAIAALAVFGWYLSSHRELFDVLADASLWAIGEILLLYVLWFLTLTGSVHATFAICRRRIGIREQLLLNAYSTLVNFFVPGQGGVALRAIYMKKRHGLLVRNYTLATVLYYVCYAAISGLFLVLPTLFRTFASVLAILAVTGVALLASLYVGHRIRKRWLEDLLLTPATLSRLVAWTLANCATQACIYFVELKAVLPGVRLGQAVTYTGAANFSQFVALTPGAIGIRESFLLFSERLHGVPTSIVLAASVMDRAGFLLLLVGLFVFGLVTHARRTLSVQ